MIIFCRFSVGRSCVLLHNNPVPVVWPPVPSALSTHCELWRTMPPPCTQWKDKMVPSQTRSETHSLQHSNGKICHNSMHAESDTDIYCYAYFYLLSWRHMNINVHIHVYFIYIHKMRCRYNAANFPKKNHKEQPVACPLGQYMGCFLRIQNLIDIWVPAIIYAIYQNSEPCHYGTRLYMNICFYRFRPVTNSLDGKRLHSTYEFATNCNIICFSIRDLYIIS